MPILHKFFQKIEEEETLPSSFYEATITLILKTDKDISRKEYHKPVSFINIDIKTSMKYKQIESNNI